MTLFRRNRFLTYMLVFLLAFSCMTGCNRGNDQPADEAAQDENAGTDNGDDAAAPATDNAGNTPATTPLDAPDEPDQTPIAEKSPVAVTRIGPDQKTNTTTPATPGSPMVTGSGYVPTDMEPFVDEDGDGVADRHQHTPAPNMFAVDKCQVEVNGSYKKQLATELINEINKCRKEYGIDPVTRNTALLSCADNRAKEQTYFIGHFRPNGAPFSSIAPGGQVLGECIAVDYRDAEKMVDAWYAVNDTRMQLMNPDYTQVGVSIYEVDDTYYIAAEFSY